MVSQDDFIRLRDSKNISISTSLKSLHHKKQNADYIAPEIINGDGDLSSPGLDHWSMETVLFEFLVGVPPFNIKTTIFHGIKSKFGNWRQG